MQAGPHTHSRASGTASRAHSLGSIQLWIALFALGVGILGLKSVVFNLVYNHLIFFNWGNLGALMVGVGIVGLSSNLPDQFNLWLKIKKWSKDHKLFASLLVLGPLMLNPTFTVLMAMTGYLIEQHFSRQLQQLSDLIKGSYHISINFLKFLGGLRNPAEFVKSLKENIGKVISTVMGIASASAFYSFFGWAIRPLIFTGLEASAGIMQTLGTILNHGFSGGFIPMFVLNTFANTIVYTMAVLVPLSIVFIGGASAAWLWDNRQSIAKAIDTKFDAIIKDHFDPVISRLADKTRAFRAHYMGMKFKDKAAAQQPQAPVVTTATMPDTTPAKTASQTPKAPLNFDQALLVLDTHHKSVIQRKGLKAEAVTKSVTKPPKAAAKTKSAEVIDLDPPSHRYPTRRKGAHK